MKSVILEGGIKGWAGAGDEYVRLMEGYQESVWMRQGVNGHPLK